jgi:glycosyltransferase A (GT-A) superfamily protein (DUF2064 family)
MSPLGAVLLVEETEPPEELEAALGPGSAAALQAELTAQATAWARELGSGSFYTAESATPLPGHVDSVLASAAGPVLIVWPRLLRWRTEHGAGAVDDLEAGCDVVFGPMIDGGLYLLGLGRPLPEVLEAVQEGRQPAGPGTSSAWTTAAELGLEIGYLRPERGLRSAADVEAARADPLTPPAIARILT